MIVIKRSKEDLLIKNLVGNIHIDNVICTEKEGIIYDMDYIEKAKTLKSMLKEKIGLDRKKDKFYVGFLTQKIKLDTELRVKLEETINEYVLGQDTGGFDLSSLDNDELNFKISKITYEEDAEYLQKQYIFIIQVLDNIIENKLPKEQLEEYNTKILDELGKNYRLINTVLDDKYLIEYYINKGK